MKIYHIQLAIVLTFFCANSNFGWTLEIYNFTHHEAWVEVEYSGCKTDNVIIKPHRSTTINAKECLVTHIRGALVPTMLSKKEVADVYRYDRSRPTISIQEWKVSGHRNFYVTIVERRNGIYGIDAHYHSTIFN